MCGIVGILAARPVAPLLLEGLQRLEYRGYDSAGMATLINGHIDRRRAEGKIAALANLLAANPLPGTIGIGHTRWATHGKPVERNAHPHASDRVAVVHNGIIENYLELRAELGARGHIFSSDTDTEVVAHLITDYLQQGQSPELAAQSAYARLRGAFALGIIIAGRHDLLLGKRLGSPLAVGYGPDGEMYLGSDALALAPLTDQIAYLEDGDSVILARGRAQIHDTHGQPVERPIVKTNLQGPIAGKGGFQHFMLKEIYEQPTALGETITSLLDPASGQIALPPLPFAWPDLPRLTITGCGTAFYAGMVGKYWLERLAQLPVELDIASELRYRGGPLPTGGAMLALSQSGETSDTLAALRLGKMAGQQLLGIINVPHSSMQRLVDVTIPTLAGPEIGVASTKAFTAQLAVLFALAVAAGTARGTLSIARADELAQHLAGLPAIITTCLQQDDVIRRHAARIAVARDVLYLGRGLMLPLALEGALKLKEISYIHAEGYAAGELKHGPIALIDERVPVIVLAPFDSWFEKTLSNLQEVVARGGQVLALTDPAGAAALAGLSVETMVLPTVDPLLMPLVMAIPLQQLAYFAALAKGTDIDQPRNLAKSVTVE